MKNLLLLLLLSACGTKTLTHAPVCEVIDTCTNANVDGYECQTRTHFLNENIESKYFNNKSCLVTKEDFYLDPTCNKDNPNNVCHSWTGKEYPCCPLIQGPGQKAI